MFLVLIFAGMTPIGRGSPAPGLSIVLLSSTNVQLTVTNGVSGEIYELFYTTYLEDGYHWNFFATGAASQTNFTVSIAEVPQVFFKARAGSDWDNDGVPNTKDADPNDPNIGILTVTIESPANGSTLY
jgi:hypothetical protein